MKAVLLDIDGTTLLGRDPLPGARALVTWLRATGVAHLWMTNNTSLTRAAWLGRLADAGLEPQPRELYTAGDATIDFLRGLEPAPRVDLLATAEVRREFAAAGIVLSEDDADTLVLGYDTELTYAKLRRAALALRRGVAFYATHPDVTCPTPEGPIPDVGSFMALFEAACGRRPVVLGKPEPTMAAGALARLGVAAHEAVMVGDRLATDIRMAGRAGLASCLVRTGVTSDAELAASPDQPTQVCDDLAGVHAWLRAQIAPSV